MSKKILVTDSLFVFDEHVKQLEGAGYEVERLDKPNATDDELIEALQGKVGYILGGIEKVTDKVLESTDTLKAIAFTGADYESFIPGWQTAKKKGIAIANAPGANAYAVAEFALAVALAMQRNLFELGRTGDKTFETTGSLQGATVGVIGAGNIGSKIINMVQPFSPNKIAYYSRTKKDDIDAEFVELDELLAQSDIVFIAVPESAGQLINTEAVPKIKNNALLVTVSGSAVDYDAILPRLKEGSLRAAIDWPAPTADFEELPNHIWFNTNDHTAYNTFMANKAGSDMGTQSLINLLETGEDKYRVV